MPEHNPPTETPDLAELWRLAEAATPGPWYLDGPWWYGDDDTAYCISTAEDAGRIAVTIAPPGYMFGGKREVRDANARYIAAANPAVVLALLDDVAALRAELAHMTEARDNARVEVERLTALLADVRAAVLGEDSEEWTRMAGTSHMIAASYLLRILDGRADS